jgi:hypothetical protein
MAPLQTKEFSLVVGPAAMTNKKTKFFIITVTIIFRIKSICQVRWYQCQVFFTAVSVLGSTGARTATPRRRRGAIGAFLQEKLLQLVGSILILAKR